MDQQTKDGEASALASSCPICLGPVNDESFLDQCYHKFCYKCILHWTKVVVSKYSVAPPQSVKCPLCKVENLSIVQCSDGLPYKRHYVNQDYGNSNFFTKVHKYRLECYYCDTGCLSNKFNVPRYWKLLKYLQPNRWLHDWIRREVQALTQEENVEIIVHHILGVIESFKREEQKSTHMMADTKRGKFKVLVAEAARCFLSGQTDRFVDELEIFLASELNIVAYDKVYVQHLGWKVPGIDIEEPIEHAPIVPYLHLLDEDTDNTD